MPFTLTEILTVVKQNIPLPQDQLPEEGREESIRDALEDYAGDIPRKFAVDVSGTAEQTVFSLPSDFVDGWSTIKSVESPIGERPPIYLTEENDYEVVQTGSGTVLSFIAAPDLPFRIAFRGQHTLQDLDSATSTTIPAAHQRAFGYLASHHAALKAAAKFATTRTSPLAGDTVNYRTKEQEWRSISEEFRKKYEKIVKESDEAAVHFFDLDTPKLVGIVPKIWHGRRRT